MADLHETQLLDQPRFQSLLVTCLESLERGVSVDRGALARDYPEFADEVERFLNDREQLEQAAASFADLSASPETPPAINDTVNSKAPPQDAAAAGNAADTIGDYVVLQEIARGGMGVVFKARQETLGRTVALKMIRAGRLADADDVLRFEREARAAAQLKHPNIVPVHDVGTHEGRHYFTMDFVEGPTLADEIREAPMAPRRAAELVRKIAVAVQYAHVQGTVHRDLKPGNILLDADSQPQITDFGLAKVLAADDPTSSELTASGQILGTPSYMSPEQAAGKRDLIGVASDVYSLGAILYACLTGRAPFAADSPFDTLLQVMRKDPVSLHLLNPATPKDLETICLKCLSKEPRQRYATAQDLADDLRRFLEGRPVVARPIGAPAKVQRWAKRNPWIAGFAALSAFLLIGGTIISSYFAVEAHQRADEAENARQEVLAALADAEESERESERSLYFARIQTARNHWKQGLVDRTREILDTARETSQHENIRNWEWYWLQSLRHQEQETLVGGPGAILTVAANPTGQTIASGGEDGTVRLWNGDDGTLIHVFDERQGPVRTLAWSPDGQMLCAAGADGAVSVWDVERQRLLDREQASADQVNSVAWSPDGNYLASGGQDQHVHIWSFADSQLNHLRVLPAMSWPIYSIAWSEQNDWLYVGYGGWRTSPRADLAIWNVKTWKKRRAADYDVATDFPLRSIALSDDGRQLATTAAHGRVKIYDAKNMRETASFSDSARVTCVAWSPDRDNPLLACSGESQTIRILDPRSKSIRKILWGHAGTINALSWETPGTLVSAGSDGTVKTWDVSRFDEATVRRTLPNYVSELSWAPDSRRIAVAYLQYDALLWDTSEKNPDVVLRGHKSRIWSVDWHPAGRWVATAAMDKTVRVWDAATGEQAWCSEVQSGGGPAGRTVAWSPDGSKLAAKLTDIVVWDFDVSAGRCGAELSRRARPPYFGLCDLAWHPNGILIASPRGEEGNCVIDVWDARTGEVQQTIDAGAKNRDKHEVRAIQWSPDGTKLLWGDVRGFLYLWDDVHKRMIFSIRAHQDAIAAVRWSPDGQRLATSGWEGTVKVRNSENGEEMLVFRDDLGRMQALGWSPDGMKLAAGNWSDEHSYVRIWDTTKAHNLNLPTTAVPPTAEDHRELTEALKESTADGSRLMEMQSLIAQLASEDDQRRVDALNALANTKPAPVEALPKLLEILEREDSHEKLLAIRCIGRIGPAVDPAVAPLLEILKSEDSGVFRVEAAGALTRVDATGETAIPTLIGLLKNPGKLVKTYPSGDSPSAMGLMTPLLHKGGYFDSRDATIIAAIGALGTYGAAAQDALPEIERIRDDPLALPTIRDGAEQAIQHIQAELDGQNPEQ